MKLEEATKEELILWIKRRIFKLKGALEEFEEFENDILCYRIEKNSAEQERLHKMYKETLIEYIELLKPFEGVQIRAVPQDILDKAIKLQEKMSKINKKSQKKQKRILGV